MNGIVPATWKCQLEGAEPLTVGEVRQLSCQGDSVELKREGLKILTQTKASADAVASFDTHRLFLLKTEKLEAQGGLFIVTSYKTGPSSSTESFLLTDGERETRLDGVALRVSSVLKPAEAGQEQKPFGPAGPVFFWWGLEYWIFLAVTVFMGVLWGLLRIKGRLERRSWKKEIEKLKITRPAFDEFHRSLRQLVRQRHLENSQTADLSQLRELFFDYVSRSFEMPVRRIPRRRFVRLARLSKKWGPEMESVDLILREFESMSKKMVAPSGEEQNRLKAASEQDWQQMLNHCRDFSETFERVQKSLVNQRGPGVKP